jgi:hypothetical protein
VASQIGVEEHHGAEVEAGELREVQTLLLGAVALEEGEDRLHGLHALLSCFLHRTGQKEPARSQKLGFVFGRHNNPNHLHTTTTPIFCLERNAF